MTSTQLHDLEIGNLKRDLLNSGLFTDQKAAYNAAIFLHWTRYPEQREIISLLKVGLTLEEAAKIVYENIQVQEPTEWENQSSEFQQYASLCIDFGFIEFVP